MNPAPGNRFEEFFADEAYVTLKNHLYNYLLRKRAVGRCLGQGGAGLTLEIGSGLSPTVDESEGVVFSELSFSALRTLKARRRAGMYVAADACRLPFRAATFARIVCSEVVEHLSDDRPAFREMSAALRPGGSLILTFPNRRGYFACDDRFVRHYRRYDLAEAEDRLREAGLDPVEVRKVLGPLEKVTMILVTACISAFRSAGSGGSAGATRGETGHRVLAKLFLWLNLLYCLPIRFDNWLAPRSLSAVLLVRSVKGENRVG